MDRSRRVTPSTSKERNRNDDVSLKFFNSSFPSKKSSKTKAGGSSGFPPPNLLMNEVTPPMIPTNNEDKKTKKKYPIEPAMDVRPPEFWKYVHVTRTPSEIKAQNLEREKDIVAKEEKKMYKMDTPRSSFGVEVTAVASPMLVGSIKPGPASRTPSQTLPFVPPPRWLELKAPKSGIVINETRPLQDRLNAPIPVPPKEDPRVVQQKIEEMDDTYYIMKARDQTYAIPKAHYPPKGGDFGGSAQSGATSGSNDQHAAFRRDVEYEENTLDTLPTNIPRTAGNVKSVRNDKANLGHPVGVLLGSFNKNDQFFSDLSRSKQGMACCFVAFGYSFIHPEVEWTSSVMNEILIEGNKLYLDSTDEGKNPDNSIRKKFRIKDVTLEVSLADPDVIGTLESFDRRVCDVVQGLRMFFRYNKSGIFQSEDLEMLIWKKGAYFVYDSNGRTARAEREKDAGLAALITLVKMENLVCFILNNCGLNTRSPFKITCIKMIKLFRVSQTENAGVAPKMTNFRECEWTVINNTHAVLSGQYHIGDRMFGDSRHKQSMTCSVMAMVYSKIDPPNTWTRKILHKVLHMGNKMYVECKGPGRPALQLALKDLPAIFNIGQFQAKVCVQPFVYNCNLPRSSRDATKFIANYFSTNEYMLVQMKGQCYSIYLKRGVFYLFDPFKRNKVGALSRDKCGAACLHMFSLLNDLCRFLFANLIAINPEDNFYLHAFQILDIDENENLGEKILNNYGATTKKCDLEGEQPEILSREESVDDYMPMRGVCKDTKDRVMKNLNSPGMSTTQLEKTWDRLKIEEEAQGDDDEDDGSEDSDTLSPITSFLRPEDIPVESEFKKKKKPKRSSPSAIQICNEMFDEVYKVFNEYIQEIEDEIYDQEDNLDAPQPILKKKKGPPKAKQILVKSDLQYLRSLKGRVTEGLEPPGAASEEPKKVLTMEEELALPHNFELMPDRSQIVFGTKSIYDMPIPYGIDQMNALVGIAALVASHKYSIATWDASIVDFTLDIAVALGQNIPVNQSLLYSAPRFRFGTVKIGHKMYDLMLKNLATGVFGNLLKILEKMFEMYDRVVIITTCDSFSVFKRYNFYYLYEGYPCDLVGFRVKEGGRACFTRFMCLSALVQRIEANRLSCMKGHRVGISNIRMHEVECYGCYDSMTESKTELAVEAARKQEECRALVRDKCLADINEQIRAEKERILKFRSEKYPSGQFPTALNIDDSIDEEADVRVKTKPKRDPSLWKHKPGIVLASQEPTYLNQVHCLSEIGYLRRDKDHLYKIQGSFSLPNRAEIIPNEVKSCYFVAIYAIIYVIHHPVLKQNYRKVDLILENGLRMASKIESREVCKKRYIRKILVDNFFYNLVIKEYEIHNPFSRLTLEIALDTFFQTKKYLILQYDNCCFVVFKDELFHVFDPYATLETCDGKAVNTDDSTPLEENETPVPDRNTASWVLLTDLTKVISYIVKRLTNPSDLNTNYIMITVNILDYEKAPKSSAYAQFLMAETDYGKEQSCPEPERLDFEDILWVERLNKVPWSRLQNMNIVGQVRKTPMTTYKAFDVEIPNELYSLWGSLHPRNRIFPRKSRGKQYLAISVVACLMANLYKIDEWNSQLLDEIVQNGDWYFRESTKDISLEDYEVSLEDMNLSYRFASFEFQINLQLQVAGTVYNSRLEEFNVARALPYFFSKWNYGILQSNGRVLAFGKGVFGYFLYDCKTRGFPIFENGIGAPYLLKCTSQKRLLHCIILTLQIIYHRVEFTIHSVEMQMTKVDSAGGNEEKAPLIANMEDATGPGTRTWEDLLAETVEKMQKL